MRLDWGEPLWLLLLLALPLYGYLIFRRPGSAVDLPRSGEIAAFADRRRLLVALPELLRICTIISLILALSRPRTPGEVIEEPGEGVPIVIALDISSSMLAEDFRPRNRLTVAKQNIARFIANREDDPIGIVAFAAEAITLVPITTYETVLTRALANLQVGLLDDGTAIGEGLAVAVNRLRRVPGESRIVILMSDGESNRGAIEPLDAARAAAASGIRVFTIGVGSEGFARVPISRNSQGVQYGEIAVGLDETLLREIARLTGGVYFRASNPRALEEVYEQIDGMVASPFEERRRVLYQEWYLPLLIAAGGCLALEWLLRGSRWGVLPG